MNKFAKLCDSFACAALVVAFGVAGIVKLITPEQFADMIDSYQVFPRILINFLANGVPAIEVFVSLLLCSKQTRCVAAKAGLLLIICFLLLLFQALVRGLKVECGCFGNLDFFGKSIFADILRDLLLFALMTRVYTKSRWAVEAT